MTSSSPSKNKVLVVGATGATGKHVVRVLLDRGDTTVVAVTRSKEKLMDLLLKLNDDDDAKDKDDDANEKKKRENNLIVKEAAIADLSPEELKALTEGCNAIVSCLGHNMTFKGMYRDGYWLRDAVQGLTENMPKAEETGSSCCCRFILMGSDGVVNPDGVTDPKRSWSERSIMSLLRYLVPPMLDNEMSALYLYQQQKEQETTPFDWCIVRPGDLIDEKKEKGKDEKAGIDDDDDDKKGNIKDDEDDDDDNEKGYDIFDHPWGSLFGGDNSITRSDVADFMVNLVTMEQETWNEKYNHKMPVVYQKKTKIEQK